MSETLQHYLRTSAGLPDAEWTFTAARLQRLALSNHEARVPAGRVCWQLAFVEAGVLRSFLTTDEQEVNNDFFPAWLLCQRFHQLRHPNPTGVDAASAGALQ